MEIHVSAEKTKLMTNNANGFQREIKVKGQMLGTVTSFKYLGAIVSDDSSKSVVLSRNTPATAVLTKLKTIQRDTNFSLGSKVKLMHFLVISIFLYACELWTLTAELDKRIQALEMRCYQRLLNISYRDHIAEEDVRSRIQATFEDCETNSNLWSRNGKRWFGHISRYPKRLKYGTSKTSNFPFVANGKLMIFRCPNILAHYN